MEGKTWGLAKELPSFNEERSFPELPSERASLGPQWVVFPRSSLIERLQRCLERNRVGWWGNKRRKEEAVCCRRRSSDGPGGTVQISGLPIKPRALEQGVNERGNHGPGKIRRRRGVSNVPGYLVDPRR